MEKNTILAVVLSIAVIAVFFAVQAKFFPQQSTPPVSQNAPAAPQPATQQQPVQDLPAPLPMNSSGTLVSPNVPVSANSNVEPPPQTVQYVTVDTELVTVVLTNAGGDLVSWKLKEHSEKEDFVEMIFSGSAEAHAFNVAFGGAGTQPETSFFHVKRVSTYIVEFYRDFTIPGSETAFFRLTKRYEFKPRDYMFQLTISLDGGNSMPGFNFSGSAYTLAYGPQIGPRFEKLDSRYEYRQYITYTNGKRKQVKVNEQINSRPSWAAISGKYFALIAIPYLTQFDISFSDRVESGVPSASRLNIVRSAVNSPKIEDIYHFYLGPKTQEALAIYNNGNNAFGLKDTQLIEAASTRGVWSWLEKILKWFLLIFHRLVPNYGVDIILLTLLIKILFFPLTKKGSESMLRMQSLAPKIKELQTRYKENPQKLNVEMAALYKAEGYNPLSGCLPMLLQFPIFIAMYNLFNTHFDLRGAMFIPRWIPDLSLPEYIWNFPGGFRLPLLGWTALRLLPFIYVGSQLLYGKVTQTPDQQGNSQMKMMLYVMPIVFFFILYDVPSGLLVYWIFSNILTMMQQVAINKYFAGKKAAQAVNSGPVIAPKRKNKEPKL